MTRSPHVLYGLPHSLYTGPARAYLRKQGIAYVERTPRSEPFARDILPVIGRSIIPVMVTPEGEIVQDSVDIIDHFEANGAASLSAYPPGPRQTFVALLLQLYGNQGLLRAAMHYRWTYYDQQARFLDHAFAAGAPLEAVQNVMRRMQSYLPGLGVTPETIPLIEQGFEDLLDILDAHFSVHPYLLGAIPSLGDYGLLGPLFAHLGRDPVPADIMKRRAPAVFRWVERMNAPDLDITDLPDAAGWVEDDGVPETLEPLIAHMGQEMGPELADKAAFLAEHVRRIAPKDGDPVSAKPHQRTIGTTPSTYRGVAAEVGVQPYLLYLVGRVRRQLQSMSGEDRAWTLDLLGRHGLRAAFDGELGVAVDRRNHIEVWAAA